MGALPKGAGVGVCVTSIELPPHAVTNTEVNIKQNKVVALVNGK
jgi:hypothetical protein